MPAGDCSCSTPSVSEILLSDIGWSLMDSSDLRFFETVAQSGNLTRAAQRLNTVQSNVTTRIKRLEEELGVPLLIRHSRGVSLTAAGQRLLPFASRVTETIEEARKTVGNGHSKEARGNLRIGTPDPTAAVRLPAILMQFAKECPQVEVLLRTGLSRDLREQVLSHKLDAAFVSGLVKEPALRQMVLWEDELVLVGPASFRDPKALHKMKEVRILVFRAGCTYRAHLEAYLTSCGITNIRQIELGTLEGMIGCVAAGMGITLLPKLVVQKSAHRNRLVVRRLSGINALIPTVFIQRADSYMSSALERFLHVSARAGGKAGRVPVGTDPIA